MNAIGAVKPGVKTVNVKKSGVVTKSMRDAQEAAAKLDAVIIPIGNGGGHTLVTKAEADRRTLIDAEKAKLAAQEPVAEPAAQPGAKKPAASARVKATKATVVATPAEPVIETTEQVIAREVAEGRLTPVGPAPAVKKPYNPEKLSGAPAAGKAPQKGQLPLGLLRMLVKRNPNSVTLKAALAAAESGATAPAKKAKKK